MFRRIAILIVLCTISFGAVAQNDSILVNGRDTIAYTYTPIASPTTKKASPKPQSKARERWMRYFEENERDRSFERKVDFSFVPAIYYTNSTSVGLAAVAAGLYRIDRQNRSIPPSNFSIYGTASITGFYRVGIKGNNIFRNDARRISYDTEFYSQPTKFWGLGYEAAMQSNYVRYNASRCMADIRYFERIVKGLYIGVGSDFNYNYARQTRREPEDYAYFIERLNGAKSSYYALGISLFVEYDTRDNLASPHRGVHLLLQGKIRPKGTSNIGSTTYYGALTVNYYQPLWRGATLALDLRGEVNSKATPWTLYASIGGTSSMRGYYEGRFADLCAVSLQAEFRQQIYKRLGGVVWGGAGNVFSYDNFAWRNTMPTYGVGLRYEVKRRVNLRLDYGFGGKDGHGRLIHGAVFSINEAF
ncbi:MAG: BamA/TamA family outer membrane protein [Alistipes sp.]|nr:BamA/TamA family outer membrane protein [Alistipes sp.]